MHCRARNRMKEHLAEMQSLKLRPSMLTYGTLAPWPHALVDPLMMKSPTQVSAYADAGDIQNAQRWYDEAGLALKYQFFS